MDRCFICPETGYACLNLSCSADSCHLNSDDAEPTPQVPAAPTLEQLAKAFDMATNPRMWNRAMNDAWHRNIPDVYAAFEALRIAAIERVTNKPSLDT